jgi:hypothetical protein
VNIAIIPTAYRTIFFHALARRLELHGHRVYWLSPNGRWARWLYQEGVARERVLEATSEGGSWGREAAPSHEELARLRELETAARLTMNDIIMMDPLLMRRSRGRALKYLATCERMVGDFLARNDIRVVFGEQTWAIELLIGQVCRERGVPHLVPHTVRIPDPRFGFFDGHTEAELLKIREVTPEDRIEAEASLKAFRARRPRPEYTRVNRRVLRPSWERLRTLVTHVRDLAGDPFDETSRRPAGLIVDHTRQLLRGSIRRFGGGWVTPPLRPARPYVFFPLHKQPEASIDIKGSPFSNQLEIIRALARTLPVSHDLYVKEHSVALSTRPGSFYRELSRIPAVRLISPFTDSFELIIGSDLVVTITGTAAYEAALLGRPAATIAPVFFDRVVACPRFDPFRDSLSRLLSAGGSAVRSAAELADILAWILANSFPGLVGDAFWQPDSLSEGNLQQVEHGFQTMLTVIQQAAAVTDVRSHGHIA